mmetsp:Transcript_34671/g.76172  ORF Transcript_34671/g.76172 Transcript_34671/m.76172 type:complete len:100 (+) Transcript_34671:700-999(+)
MPSLTRRPPPQFYFPQFLRYISPQEHSLVCWFIRITESEYRADQCEPPPPLTAVALSAFSSFLLAEEEEEPSAVALDVHDPIFWPGACSDKERAVYSYS